MRSYAQVTVTRPVFFSSLPSGDSFFCYCGVSVKKKSLAEMGKVIVRMTRTMIYLQSELYKNRGNVSDDTGNGFVTSKIVSRIIRIKNCPSEMARYIDGFMPRRAKLLHFK